MALATDTTMRADQSAALERELRLAREAIALVAAGAAPRVVVAGITYGEKLLDRVRRLGLEAGVRVNPLRRLDDGSRLDFVVEPIVE